VSTMTYYRDEIEKIKYLRNRIASSLVMNGSYPDRAIIDNRLSAIDSKLAIYSHMSVQESDKFNTKQFNNEMQDIYSDLVILYQLVYEFNTKRYEATRAYVEMHLAELEALAERHERKSTFEIGSTFIGKTIFFQTNGFQSSTSDYITTLLLGNISIAPGSKVAFFIDGRYFDKNEATFYVDDMQCPAYAKNGEYLTMPGETSCVVHAAIRCIPKWHVRLE